MYVWALTYHSIYAEAIEHPRYLFLPSTLLEVRVHMRAGGPPPPPPPQQGTERDIRIEVKGRGTELRM